LRVKVKDYIYSHIRWKLTELRKIGNVKLNISLFGVLIMPLYRLAAKAKVEVKIRVQFELFWNLPVNLSDVTFKKLFGGSVGDILLQTKKETARNLQERTRQKLATHANEAEAAQASGQHLIHAADVGGMRYNH
jgi:predicted RND superfamily exporter protein